MTDSTNRYLPPLLAALCVAFIPNIPRLPVWIVLWCGAGWAYSYLASRNDWPWPNRPTRLILTLGGCIFGLLTFGHAMGRDAGVGLLSLMVGLKPLETRTHRDRMVVVFLTYFLVIANLFYSKTLTMALYLFLSVLVTTSVLVRMQHPQGRWITHLRTSGGIMAQAMPLMVFLFFLFPRIPGSLWGLPKLGTGTTGFTDTMAPGSISELVRSSEIAFRVRFEKDIPGDRPLYWRGMVFWHFNGRIWRPGITAPLRREPISSDNPLEYTIILEPHEKRWLFALDLPVHAAGSGLLQDDHTLISRQNVKERIQYRVRSDMDYRTGPLKPWEITALSLPVSDNPKARDLAQKWREAANSDQDIVDRALRLFGEKDFFYTLNPPLSGSNPVDDFLFMTRKGYCEHYASAFAFLMRAAGIPCRVVVGYLGGTRNPFGNYLIIRQSDAHAWVEVWMPENGWMRIDPTSAVAPDRVMQGMEAALSPEDISSLYTLPYFRPIAKYLSTITMGWDAVNTLWHQHIVGYSFLRQQQVLSKIGIRSGSWKETVKWLLIAIGMTGGFVLLIIWFMFKKPVEKKDSTLETYMRFCQKLARIGLPRKSEQGPRDYACMVIHSRRDLEPEVQAIIDLYIRLRYDRGGDGTLHKEFKSRVKRFRPGLSLHLTK